MATTRVTICFLLVAAFVSAQSAPGDVTGRVTDPSGAGLPNATVIFKQVDGEVTRQAVTGQDGSFTVRDVPPGNYKVDLASMGGQHSSSQSVRIDAATPSSVSLTFTQTSGTEGGKIEIEGRSPTLQTESAEVSRAYGTVLVRQLPVIDRQAQELIGLMPGITPPVTQEDRVMDPQRQRTFHVNGLPAYANAYSQDGAYQTDPWQNNSVRIAPNESIQSLNIRTSNYNGEHGFSGGALTNTVTRPGQNQVHGSVFGFHTNSLFSTRNPLNNQGETPEPRFNQNQFGVSLGGPIKTNNAFLFGAYEGFLRRGRTFAQETVPTADLRAGNFSSLSGVLYDPNSGMANGSGRVPFANNQIPASH